MGKNEKIQDEFINKLWKTLEFAKLNNIAPVMVVGTLEMFKCCIISEQFEDAVKLAGQSNPILN